MTTLDDLLKLADDAKPTSESDWGSERQVEAENRLFDAIRDAATPEVFERLEAYCLKATTEEMIDAGVRVFEGDTDFLFTDPRNIRGRL